MKPMKPTRSIFVVILAWSALFTTATVVLALGIFAAAPDTQGATIPMLGAPSAAAEPINVRGWTHAIEADTAAGPGVFRSHVWQYDAATGGFHTELWTTTLDFTSADGIADATDTTTTKPTPTETLTTR